MSKRKRRTINSNRYQKGGWKTNMHTHRSARAIYNKRTGTHVATQFRSASRKTKKNYLALAYFCCTV